MAKQVKILPASAAADNDVEEDVFALDFTEEDFDGSLLNVAQPFRDGTATLAHDGFDAQSWIDTLASQKNLKRTVEKNTKKLATAPALFRDMFWSFYKFVPEQKPDVPVKASHKLNQRIVGQAMELPDWAKVRNAGTIGDELTSTLATTGLAEKVISLLDQDTLNKVNDMVQQEQKAEQKRSQAEQKRQEAQEKREQAKQKREQAKQKQEQGEGEEEENGADGANGTQEQEQPSGEEQGQEQGQNGAGQPGGDSTDGQDGDSQPSGDSGTPAPGSSKGKGQPKQGNQQGQQQPQSQSGGTGSQDDGNGAAGQSPEDAEADMLENLASFLEAQAEEAEREAELAETDAAITAQEVEEKIDDVEGKLGKAASDAMQEAEDKVEEVNGVIDAFNTGYSPNSANHPAQQLSIEDKQKLAELLQETKWLKDIAEMAGRMVHIAVQKQESKAENMVEEITNIISGNDLARVLPSEMTLLAEPELEDMFFKRYTDSTLQIYEMVGKDKQGRGPIVFITDESGSMRANAGGIIKNTWTKGMLIGLLRIAKDQQRDLAVIHFASAGQLRVDVFERGEASALDVAQCVQHFYDGGTVYEPFMDKALEIVQDARFKKASVIIASDGEVMVNDAKVQAWNTKRKELEVDAYGILIAEERRYGYYGTQSGDVLKSLTDQMFRITDLRQDEAILDAVFKI